MLNPPGHPPVIFLLKIADGDDTGATAHSELVLLGGPAHAASSAVDAQDDQCGLPCAALQCPHIGVAICAAGHDAVTLRGPVNACGVGGRTRLKPSKHSWLDNVHRGGASRSQSGLNQGATRVHQGCYSSLSYQQTHWKAKPRDKNRNGSLVMLMCWIKPFLRSSNICVFQKHEPIHVTAL